MANTISVQINSVDVTSLIVYPITQSETIDGDNNSGGFILNSTEKEPYPAYSTCSVTVNGVTKVWYLKDNVSQATKNSIYKHSITLIDTIQALEGYFMPNLDFTQPLQRDLVPASTIYNYKTAIQRAFALTPLRIPGAGDFQPFGLNATTAGRLENIEFPESFPTRKNLREFIFQVGNFINAVPFMENNKTSVDFRFLDDESNEIDEPHYQSFTTTQDSEQYCTEIDTIMENIVVEGDKQQGSITEPNAYGWKTFRPKEPDVRMTDENTVMETVYPINELIKVSALYQDTSADVDYNIDLTPYILESKTYDLLNNEDKLKFLYYTKGSKNIEGLYYNVRWFNLIPSTPAIRQIILEAIGGLPNNSDIKNLKYRIEYIPFNRNIRAVVTRNKDEDFTRKHSFNSNQTDNIVSTGAYGDYLQNHIERIGKKERVYITTDATPNIGEHFIDNGDYYYLTTINKQIFKNHIINELTFNKDFEKLSERIGLNALPRQAELDAGDFRADKYTEYCSLSYTSTSITTIFGDSLLARRALVGRLGILAMGDLGWESHRALHFDFNATEINSCIFRTFNEEQEAIIDGGVLMPVVSAAFGNTLLFNFSMPSPYSAGRKIVKSSGDRDGVDVAYTETYANGVNLGRFEYCSIDYFSDLVGQNMTLAEADRLPQVTDTFINANDDNFVISLGRGTNANMIYKKNANEIPSITYQLCVDTDDDLILGKAFFKSNGLLSNYNGEYVEILAENRYNRSGGVYTQADSGFYLKHNGCYFVIDNVFRRYTYDSEEEQWEIDSSGTHLLVSKETKLVATFEPIEQGTEIYKGGVELAGGLFGRMPRVKYLFGGAGTCLMFTDNTNAENTTLPFGTGWAIVDEFDRLLLASNRPNLNRVYFNFKKEKFQ